MRGFLHYANETEGATLDQSLSRKAAFEGFDSGDLQIFRFLNLNTNDHIFTSDAKEIAALRDDNNFVEEGVVFNLLSEEVAGSQAIHRFLNTEKLVTTTIQRMELRLRPFRLMENKTQRVL